MTARFIAHAPQRLLVVAMALALSATGLPFTAAPARAATTQIWEIQGESHISPLNGQQVFGVNGIVTAVSGIGFWMTDPDPDGDNATSDGIFVFRGTAGSKPMVSDHVTVDGTVSEFRPGGGATANLTTTQIGGATFEVLSTGNSLPVTVVGQGGRMPPTEIIDDDSTGSVEHPDAVYDPDNDGIDFYESLEGMYLQVNEAVAVGPTNAFGEIAVVADGGANAGPRTPRGGIVIGPDDFNPERIILDDVIRPTPRVNTGDGFTTSVTGVLDYSFGNFKLLVTTDLVRVDNGLRREVTDVAGPRELAVATFNVENLSNQDDQSKFDELAGMIVHNLRAPDLLGIEEVQDDSGFANDGTTTAAATWQRLIDTIAAAGGPAYEHRQIDPVDLADGGAPGGNIRVGFLFRTDRGLEFIDRPGGTSTNDTAAIDHPSGPQLTFSPGRIGTADQAFLETRKSLAGEFRFRGQKLFVVVNHFSSKSGDDPLFGRWQPPVRYSEFANPSPVGDTDGWRWGQAQVINDFVDDLLALDTDANVIVLGDINDFQFSDTVRILTGTAADVGTREVAATGEAPVLTTLFDLLPQDEQYSYVFDGNSQVLDQILVSNGLLAFDPEYDVVHVNSEFFDQASDHEPSVMQVEFQP
ncbi:MAG: endonuclease/exonuclease/phosphatase family protein [Candidatus Limnocylindria bacterium]